MSAFLGPIHLWLYKKIKFQEEMTEAIFELAAKEDWNKELRKETRERYGELEQGKLENIIDTSNIHGWLQERIRLVESRFAYAVTALKASGEERMASIYEAMKEFGNRYAINTECSPEDAYAYLDTLLLNGMPCDRVNEVVRESEEEIQWVQNVDIHGDYWNSVGGNTADYYNIRKALTEGLLKGTRLMLTQDKEVYRIGKGEV